MFRRILGIFFLVIGLSALLLYFSIDQITKYVSRPQNVEVISVQELEENDKRAVPDHNEVIEDYDVVTAIMRIPEIDKKYIIGQIFIPEVSMNLPIVKGVTNANLMLGAATMKLDQKMGEGNYALAGHYTYTPGVLFRDVHTLPIGTHVYITDKKTIYHYQIFSRDNYPSDAFYMIEDSQAEKRGKAIISLMVCNVKHDYGRTFAVGELIGTRPYEEGILDIFNQDPMAPDSQNKTQ